MTEMKTGKNKHLSLEERMEIQVCLDHGMTFKAIGRRVHKDQTTISKEVKKHITVRPSQYVRRNEQGAVLPHEVCPLLLKAPFVCNACPKKHGKCKFDKQVYLGNHAHKAYRNTLSQAREGIALDKQVFYDNDRVISEGIKKGQHLYHILSTCSLPVSKSSVYRYLKKGYLSVAAIDFPRVVKFKPRKKHYALSIPAALKSGRSFQDFQSHIELYDVHSWVEMDTVIGRVGGKCLLTFDFTFCNFMFGILLDNRSAAEVSSRILRLKERLADAQCPFGSIFPLLLTDNGGEFSDVFSIENAADGSKESDLFFCDPNSAYQKPHVEKNHTVLRDILPKGTSFDSLNQDAVDLIFSHVNSVRRKQLNGKSPFEVFAFTFGDHIPRLLGVSSIDPAQVIQSPRLLDLIRLNTEKV